MSPHCSYNNPYTHNHAHNSPHSFYVFYLTFSVNLSVLVLACYQAFQARDIQSEFSEATYIGFAVFSFCQAILTGIPIVAVVKDIPEAFYLVATFLIFVLCMVVLLLIFLPKIFMERTYAKLSHKEQKKMMAMSIRKSVKSSSGKSGGPVGTSVLDPSFDSSGSSYCQACGQFKNPRTNHHPFGAGDGGNGVAGHADDVAKPLNWDDKKAAEIVSSSDFKPASSGDSSPEHQYQEPPLGMLVSKSTNVVRSMHRPLSVSSLSFEKDSSTASSNQQTVSEQSKPSDTTMSHLESNLETVPESSKSDSPDGNDVTIVA